MTATTSDATDCSDRAVRELNPDESLALLQTHDVGRVVYTDHALPAITPVNYIISGHSIIFRTSESSRIAYGVPGSVVAFEVDALDREQHTGWSVVVVGVATRLLEGSEQVRALGLPLTPWLAGDRPVFIRVSAAQITGRRLEQAAVEVTANAEHRRSG